MEGSCGAGVGITVGVRGSPTGGTGESGGGWRDPLGSSGGAEGVGAGVGIGAGEGSMIGSGGDVIVGRSVMLRIQLVKHTQSAVGTKLHRKASDHGTMAILASCPREHGTYRDTPTPGVSRGTKAMCSRILALV